MSNRLLRLQTAMTAVVVGLSLAPAPAAVQAPAAAAKTWEPPRTADGQPDIQGIWRLDLGITPAGEEDAREVVRGNSSGETYPLYTLDGTCAEEHTAVTGGKPRTYKSAVVDPADGRIPYQPWAEKKKQENCYNHTRPTKDNIDNRARCYLQGVPRTTYEPDTQIIQIPGYVLMLVEIIHGSRIIPLDGRPHVGANIKLFQGDSRGRWEGNTLVIDVTNQNDKTFFDDIMNFHSDALHGVEGFTFVDADTIQYEAMLEDPKVYTRPWKLAFTFHRRKDKGYELMEHACYEGERSAKKIIFGQ